MSGHTLVQQMPLVVNLMSSLEVPLWQGGVCLYFIALQTESIREGWTTVQGSTEYPQRLISQESCCSGADRPHPGLLASSTHLQPQESQSHTGLQTGCIFTVLSLGDPG